MELSEASYTMILSRSDVNACVCSGRGHVPDDARRGTAVGGGHEHERGQQPQPQHPDLHRRDPAAAAGRRDHHAAVAHEPGRPRRCVLSHDGTRQQLLTMQQCSLRAPLCALPQSAVTPASVKECARLLMSWSQRCLYRRGMRHPASEVQQCCCCSEHATGLRQAASGSGRAAPSGSALRRRAASTCR